MAQHPQYFNADLAKAGVEVNRKMLADLAVNDATIFAKLVEVAKNANSITIHSKGSLWRVLLWLK